MKVGISFPFQSLCFLITLVVFNILQPLVATAEQEIILEPVYDIEGERVRSGTSYYVLASSGDKGGLKLGFTRNKTCPLDLIRDPYTLGNPVFFDTRPLTYVPTFTDLTVRSPNHGPCLRDSTVWELSQVSPPGSTPRLWFVSTNGTAGTTPTLFKIEQLEGEYHSRHIYYFKFCPSNVPYQPICGPLGTYVDADGTEALALGDGIGPFYVRFQRVPYQGGLSIV